MTPRQDRLFSDRLLLVALVVGLLAGPLLADTIATMDGKVFIGKIIKESSGSVVIEIHRYGAKAEQTVKRSNIRNIIRGEVKPTRAKPPESTSTTPKAPRRHPQARIPA